jgi:hypothetical protein
LFVYILTFVKEPIEHVILISCNITLLYTGIVVQLSSLTKRLNKRSIAESNLIYIDKTNMINSVEFVIREVIELLFHGR